MWVDAVASTTAVDAQTVEFRLNKKWPTFPSMLALGHGMIVAAGAGEGEAFKPIGAGPFVLDRYAPNEERVLTARADYWNGKPKSDKLRFIALSGSRENLESMRTNGIDIGFLRGNPQAIYDTIDAGYPGSFSILNSGGAELVNNREGRPGADVRVRRAIALAIDPELVGQRGDNGLGLPGKAMFNDLSRWATDVEGVPFDPDAARKLLDEAKADGYDGKLNYIVLQEPSEQAIGLAVQSLLQAVGFTVNIINANNAGDIVKQVYVQRDYDMAHAGIGLYEAIPYQLRGLFEPADGGAARQAAGGGRRRPDPRCAGGDPDAVERDRPERPGELGDDLRRLAEECRRCRSHCDGNHAARQGRSQLSVDEPVT